jgi:phosphoglucosamine mutase
MVDRDGTLIDGDELLYIIAIGRHRQNCLPGGVVGTLMTNLGFEHALKRENIPFVRTAVGDRYVMEKLQEQQWLLGGESSGHIIILDRTTTGDGIVSALQVLAAMVTSGSSLTELRAGMTKYPQQLINVRLTRQADVLAMPAVQQAMTEAELQLADTGRILLRPSGTEPLIRVMVEGQDASQVKMVAEQLAGTVTNALEG